MKAVANVPLEALDRIWNGRKRFANIYGPDVSGADIVIRTKGDPRHIYGLATDYEDGIITVEIFSKEVL